MDVCSTWKLQQNEHSERHTMKTVLLSLVAVSVLSTSGSAAEVRPVDVPHVVKLSQEVATAAETIRQSGAQIPKPLAIRRSILVLSERIARTAGDWPPIPESASNLSDSHRQQCRKLAARMMEDTENLVEAIRSLKNTADAAHNTRTAQEAKRMATIAWALRTTVRKLQRELGDPGVTRMVRSGV